VDGFSRPWPNPGIAGRHYAEEEFVRGVSRGELLRARAPSEMTDGNENGVPAKCRHEKHDRPARLLRPRETQGRIPVAIGSPLFWRGCEAREILLTRIFAEQYYRTRARAIAVGAFRSIPCSARPNGAHSRTAPGDGEAPGTSCVLNGPQACAKVPSERRTSPLFPSPETDEAKRYAADQGELLWR
jgi:hypothetical protein